MSSQRSSTSPDTEHRLADTEADQGIGGARYPDENVVPKADLSGIRHGSRKDPAIRCGGHQPEGVEIKRLQRREVRRRKRQERGLGVSAMMPDGFIERTEQ